MKIYFGFLLSLLLTAFTANAAYVVPNGSITQQKFAAQSIESARLMNCTIATSVGSNALTIALKDNTGADTSTLSPCSIAFRNATAATGTYVTRSVTGALSLVVSSGSTLGCISAVQCTLYVYAVDTGSGVVLGVVNGAVFDQGALVSSTAEGGAGAADSTQVLYTTSAQSNKPVRLIAKVLATQATAGTWATAPSLVAPWPFKAGCSATSGDGTACTFSWKGSTTCVVSNETGGDSINGNGSIAVGAQNVQCTYTFNSGFCTGAPNCALGKDGGYPSACFAQTATTSSITTTCSNGGSATNYDHSVICQCNK